MFVFHANENKKGFFHAKLQPKLSSLMMKPKTVNAGTDIVDTMPLVVLCVSSSITKLGLGLSLAI